MKERRTAVFCTKSALLLWHSPFRRRTQRKREKPTQHNEIQLQNSDLIFCLCKVCTTSFVFAKSQNCATHFLLHYFSYQEETLLTNKRVTKAEQCEVGRGSLCMFPICRCGGCLVLYIASSLCFSSRCYIM